MLSPRSSSTALVASLWFPLSVTAFVTPRPASLLTTTTTTTTTTTQVFGYLDDLSKELYAPDGSSSREEVDTEKMNMNKEQIDRYGVGSWEGFVDFDEFDGGDGQMGVAGEYLANTLCVCARRLEMLYLTCAFPLPSHNATTPTITGDGNKGLEKEWQGSAEMAKSKTMSAKNAWGKSTGYADELIKKGVDTARAQQMENWKNQQEVLAARKQQRWMTEEFDKKAAAGEEDWRNLSKYSGERLADTDLDQQLGDIKPGDKIYHHIQLSSRVGRPEIMEFDITVSGVGRR
eukprot:scaffold2903_cov170-Amphora_coffeaeformis.AAC.5